MMISPNNRCSQELMQQYQEFPKNRLDDYSSGVYKEDHEINWDIYKNQRHLNSTVIVPAVPRDEVNDNIPEVQTFQHMDGPAVANNENDEDGELVDGLELNDFWVKRLSQTVKRMKKKQNKNAKR